MKHLLAFIPILLVAISISQAQLEPPCTYSCPPPFTEWVHVIDTSQSMPNGACPDCSIAFEYWYRECGGEIQIVLGTVSYTGDCADCVSWMTWYVADWVAKNNPLILAALDSNWQPDTLYCHRDTKFSMVTCYEWVPGGGGGVVTNPDGWHTVPCNTTECCIFELEICKNPDGTVQSAHQLLSSPVICDSNCFNGCGFFSDYYEKINIDQNLNRTGEEKLITISPNPSKGTFSIEFNSVQKGNYTFVLNDIVGNQVFSETLNISSSHYLREISTVNILTGAYIYNIIYEGKVYQTGKLNFIK